MPVATIWIPDDVYQQYNTMRKATKFNLSLFVRKALIEEIRRREKDIEMGKKVLDGTIY